MSSVREALFLSQHRADVRLNLPHMPTRDQLFVVAKDMFVKTNCLEDIVERAYVLLIESVHSLLVIPPPVVTSNSESRASMDCLRQSGECMNLPTTKSNKLRLESTNGSLAIPDGM